MIKRNSPLHEVRGNAVSTNVQDASFPRQQTVQREVTCPAMSTFFTMYFQSFFALLSFIAIVTVILVICLFSWPYYSIWKAEKGIQEAELIGMAELALANQQAQIIVEQAQTRRVAMGLLATGQKSAATQQADAIKLVGEAMRRYPDNDNDTYLQSMFNQLD